MLFDELKEDDLIMINPEAVEEFQQAKAAGSDICTTSHNRAAFAAPPPLRVIAVFRDGAGEPVIQYKHPTDRQWDLIQLANNGTCWLTRIGWSCLRRPFILRYSADKLASAGTRSNDPLYCNCNSPVLLDNYAYGKPFKVCTACKRERQ
jgi:hypothetical protein